MNKLTLKLTFRGQEYAIGTTQYSFDQSGQVLIGKVIITDKDKQELADASLSMALEIAAEELAREIATQAKRIYAKEIKEATSKYLRKNKKALVAEFVKQAKKDALARVEEVYES